MARFERKFPLLWATLLCGGKKIRVENFNTVDEMKSFMVGVKLQNVEYTMFLSAMDKTGKASSVCVKIGKNRMQIPYRMMLKEADCEILKMIQNARCRLPATY